MAPGPRVGARRLGREGRGAKVVTPSRRPALKAGMRRVGSARINALRVVTPDNHCVPDSGLIHVTSLTVRLRGYKIIRGVQRLAYLLNSALFFFLFLAIHFEQ